MNSEISAGLIATLKQIVGDAQVLTGERATRAYRTGFRSGGGPALAVVRPRLLVEQWRVLEACVAANTIVIMQAANTGLTGGSTPAARYDRDVVVVNTMLIDKAFLVANGQQVICLPGATLDGLERMLAPLGREPHSVIGSSCFGASVIGGVCNNSGGSLITRGPAFTEMALFAKLNAHGRLELVNHLNLRLGTDPEAMLAKLERGDFDVSDVETGSPRRASDTQYQRLVREVDANSPARFNADPRRLFEASGSAGRLAVFAVRLDTFPKSPRTGVFYIGTSDPADLTQLRRHVLQHFKHLPIAGEYLHRTMYDVAARYGKDVFLVIEMLGTRWLSRIFRVKQSYDSWASRLPFTWASSDKLLQLASRLLPRHLPKRMDDFRDRFPHHLILKMGGEGVEEARAFLRSAMPQGSGDFFECTPAEARKAYLHRFVAAGAAVRYAAVHDAEVAGIAALDIALKRNDPDWVEALPDDILEQIHLALYYGHFFCHVFHQDYIVRKGRCVTALKERLLNLLDERGAEYPAEHNVGHEYVAKAPLLDFYRSLDPCNGFNPGIGKSSKEAHWKTATSDLSARNNS